MYNLPPDEEKLPTLTSLDIQILVALAGKNMHGYGLMHACSNDTHGYINPGTGAIYAALKRLLEFGYIDKVEEVTGSGSSNKRNMYGLSELGSIILGREANRLIAVGQLANKRLKA